MRGEAWRGPQGEDSGSPYYEKRKYPEPTLCSRCGLVYHQGRWTQADSTPGQANRELCPACRRVQDRNPGGLLHLSGDYLKLRTQEIMNVAHNQEQMAREHRPLQRIMWVKQHSDEIEIATTNFHLARRIGEAIHHAHKGELAVKYSEGDRFARVYWRRDSEKNSK